MSRKQNRQGYCKKCNDKAMLSKRGLCYKCSTCNQALQQKHLKQKKGLYYDQWRKACKRAFEQD